MTTPWIEPRTSQICVGSSKLLGLYSLRFQRYYISTNQGWRWHQLTTGILCSVSVGTLLLTPKSQSSVMSYTKSTHPENTSLHYIPCQQPIQIKPAFHGSYLTHNIPHGSDAIVWVFCLPWQRYSYMTLPWKAESYSCQCLNTKTSAWGNRGYTTETLSIFYSRYWYIRLVVTL